MPMVRGRKHWEQRDPHSQGLEYELLRWYLWTSIQGWWAEPKCMSWTGMCPFKYAGKEAGLDDTDRGMS